jgi:hypothetical protein
MFTLHVIPFDRKSEGHLPIMFAHFSHAEYPPVSVSRKLLSRTPPKTPPPINASRLACRQPIKGVVYPHILNRQRQPGMILFVVDNAHVGEFQPRF